MKRMRRCIFTWNNWEKDFEDKEAVYKYFSELEHLDYFSIGFEVGEEGTSHLQGYLHFTSMKSLKTLNEYMKKNYNHSVLGTNEQAIAYTQKDKEYIEFGDTPANEGQRTDLDDLIDAIKAGASDKELMDDYQKQYFLFKKHIDVMRQEILFTRFGEEHRDVTVIYIHGATETGKTRLVYDTHDIKDIYRLSSYGSGAFDGYKGQRVLVLDEFRSNFTMGFILQLLDRYPLQLPARYNDKVACFDTVYILSNIPLERQYDAYIQSNEPKTWKAFLRRIDKVYNFDNELDRDLANITDIEEGCLSMFGDKVKITVDN